MIVRPENPIAVQLYTVREAARDDFPGTLRRLAEGGAHAVEFASYGGMPIPELRALLDELGMRVVGSHVPLTAWEGQPDATLADIIALGGGYAVVPFVPEERRGGVTFARSLAADLNRWAAQAKQAGLGFAYHHHDFEFAPLADGGGGTLFDILVQETDPNLVGIEVDVYWAAHAGVDPAHLLGELQGRVPLLHVKDMAAGQERTDVPVGEGVLRWHEILPAGGAGAGPWGGIGQDDPIDPIAEALRAIRNMEELSRES